MSGLQGVEKASRPCPLRAMPVLVALSELASTANGNRESFEPLHPRHHTPLPCSPANSAISVSCTWCRPGSGASRESVRTVLVLGVGLWALSSEREASKISCLVPERPGRPEMTSKFRTKMTRQQLLQFSPHSCSTTLDDACLQHPLTGQLQSLSTLACDRANMAMVLSDGLVDCSWLTLCSIQSWPAECYAWSYFLLPGGRTTS